MSNEKPPRMSQEKLERMSHEKPPRMSHEGVNSRITFGCWHPRKKYCFDQYLKYFCVFFSLSSVLTPKKNKQAVTPCDYSEGVFRRVIYSNHKSPTSKIVGLCRINFFNCGRALLEHVWVFWVNDIHCFVGVLDYKL